MMSNIRCEHNLQDFECDPIGHMILTNYKLVLKPTALKRLDNTKETANDIKMLNLQRVQAFFTVTLGYLVSAEVRPVTNGQILKWSCIDIVTKDCRRLSYCIPDYKKSMQIRDTIRSIAFKEQVAPELQFNNYFARVHFDYVLKNI